VPRAEAPPPPDSGFSALLPLATASVEYGGPRPKVLTIEFLRAIVTADVLGGDDRALAQCLTERKRTQAKRRKLRTSRSLMAFSCVNCDGDAVDAPWLYCSALCAEMAKTIR
jgi:hypothetical protein